MAHDRPGPWPIDLALAPSRDQVEPAMGPGPICLVPFRDQQLGRRPGPRPGSRPTLGLGPAHGPMGTAHGPFWASPKWTRNSFNICYALFLFPLFVHFLFYVSGFLGLGWAPGPISKCRHRRDIAGCALKVKSGGVSVRKKNDFSSKPGLQNATYPFFGPLILEDQLLQECFLKVRSVFFLLCKVLRPEFCLPITPSA